MSSRIEKGRFYKIGPESIVYAEPVDPKTHDILINTKLYVEKNDLFLAIEKDKFSDNGGGLYIFIHINSGIHVIKHSTNMVLVK